MKTFLFFLIFVSQLFAIPSGRQSEHLDSTPIERRSFSEDRIQDFKADPQFDYDRESFSPINLFDIILSWLWNNFFKYLLNPGTASFWEILIYIFAFATVVYIVRQFMKAKLGSLFYKPGIGPGEISALSEDNIHGTDLNRLLEQEIKNNRFRNAVRLLYLILLKVLSDRNIIYWKIGKTNHEYCTEIKNESLQAFFSSLTQLYEYVWYGDFEISKTKFESISANFQEFTNTCGQAE